MALAATVMAGDHGWLGIAPSHCAQGSPYLPVCDVPVDEGLTGDVVLPPAHGDEMAASGQASMAVTGPILLLSAHRPDNGT